MSTVRAGDQTPKLYLGEDLISTGGAGTLVSKTITSNGTYNATDDHADGYDMVTVNVPTSGTIVSKTITANGTYNASADSADGYSPVTVNVPQPAAETVVLAADLTGYTSGQDLGNGFWINNTSGTIAVDSETVDGVTYDGLRISGGLTIETKRYFGKMSTFEVEFIINSFVSGDNRLLSTGGGFDFSVYTNDYNYLRYVAANYNQILDPTVYRDSTSNCTDNSITKASLIGAVTNIKFVDDGTYTTLYVNGVAKVNWLTGYANNSFFLYGQHVGANDAGGADMLITKLQWTASGIEYDGRNWVPV